MKPLTKDQYVQIVKGARDVLMIQGWTKGTYARDAVHLPCSPLSKRAVCFCAEGALLRAAGAVGVLPKSEMVRADIELRISDYVEEFMLSEVVAKLNKFVPRRAAELWKLNDASETIGPVLKVFDKAIKAAEA